MTQLATLTASGEPFEIGLALGRRAREVIHARLIAGADWRAAQWWRGSERLRVLEEAAYRHAPSAVEELRGIAEGAGLAFADVFAWNCRGDLPATPDRCGCSTIVVAEAGRCLIAHNEDGDPRLGEGCVIADIRPAGAPGFVAFVYPCTLPGNAFSATWSGLAQTINNVRPFEHGLGLPRILAARSVLDAPDLDSAARVLREVPRAGGYHHYLADRGGRVLSVETTTGGLGIEVVEGVHCHANHLVSGPLAGIPQRVTDSSGSRQRRLHELCRELPSRPELAHLLAALRDRRDPVLPVYRRDADDPDGENTLATALIEVDDGIRLEVVPPGREHASHVFVV